MKPIERWFQGVAVHGGTREWMVEDGRGQTWCLMLACDTSLEVQHLAEIVARLFPERQCGCRDQIDKIMHTYEMEYGG